MYLVLVSLLSKEQMQLVASICPFVCLPVCLFVCALLFEPVTLLEQRMTITIVDIFSWYLRSDAYVDYLLDAVDWLLY